MRITPSLTDQQILAELGSRIARTRLAKNMTQAMLAESSAVSKRTVERLERGLSIQCESLIWILRSLHMLRGLDKLVPEDEWGSPERALVGMRLRRRATCRGNAADPCTPRDNGVSIDMVYQTRSERLLHTANDDGLRSERLLHMANGDGQR
jgi:transcriptional regulator with XRE-family HTH domain